MEFNNYRIIQTEYFGQPCYEVYKGSEYCRQFRTKAHAVKYIDSESLPDSLQVEPDFVDAHGGEVVHTKIYDEQGNRDYDTEMVYNSYWGELHLTPEDFAND